MKERARGGSTSHEAEQRKSGDTADHVTVFAGEGSNNLKETRNTGSQAVPRKHGGMVDGEHGKHRGDRKGRKRGGHISAGPTGTMKRGGAAHNPPGRKRGGGVGFPEKHPLSGASKVKHVTPQEQDEHGVESD